METKARARILIVEDQIVTAKAIQEVLTNSGYEVVGNAVDGEQAIKMAADTSPDLILMDIKIRGPYDGITITQRIRAKSDIPIVYLTAYSDDETLKRAMHSSPHGYLLKPFDDKQLINVIEIALKRQQGKKRL